jgi:hypothetical protein
MPPLEVVGPDGGLSMLLLLRHGGEMPGGESPGRQQWRWRQTVATGNGGACFFGCTYFGGGGVEESAFAPRWTLNYVIFLYFTFTASAILVLIIFVIDLFCVIRQYSP